MWEESKFFIVVHTSGFQVSASKFVVAAMKTPPVQQDNY
jgi:hypothetical protein